MSPFSFAMKRLGPVLLLACGATLLPAQQTPPLRDTTLFDHDWKFFLGDAPGADRPAFDDSAWRTLDLPHDWSIEGGGKPQVPGEQEGPFDAKSPAGAGGAYLDGGVGWYRKTFTLPAGKKGRQFSILFDGAYENADVYLNGTKLGSHPYGFTSFHYDLTPSLKFGPEANVLAVRLDVKQPGLRWYSGAGIYRHVWLIDTARVHVPTWGTYVTTPKADANGSEIKVVLQVQNDGKTTADAAVRTVLLDPAGTEVAHQETPAHLAPGAVSSTTQDFSLASAHLWSCDDPALYKAVTTISVDGNAVDSVTTRFGIRTIKFTVDRGFFLNGRHVQIKGVCDHHDLGCLGAAAYRRAIQRQLETIKSFGGNALRTSHNPPSPELLDLCDEMGILVMDEAFDEWKENHQKYGYGDAFDQWSEPDLVSMLQRDRNHPSVILWSIGNEIPEGRGTDRIAGVMAKRLAGICHREDPTRPVTSACPSPDNAWENGLGPALDVFGINYNPNFYALNDPAHKPASGYPGTMPMVGSETSSQVDSRGEYGLTLDAQGQVKIVSRTPDHQVSSYDLWHPGWAQSAETEELALRNNPWIAGEFVWTGFDYLGEPTPFRWPSRSSYFGIVDLAGFPKDRYYFYQSVWCTAPVVHLLPMSWNWPGFEGKAIPVRVFTNADSVELFLNGKSLGVKNWPADAAQQTLETDKHDKKTKVTTTIHETAPGLHLEWQVPYASGELKAVATKQGQIVATDIVRTAGAPARLVLQADRSAIAGDGEDLSFIKVSILDQDDNPCPNAGNEITFSVAGNAATIAGLDNGDATNHEFFQGTQHQAFHGLALAVLRSKYGASGNVTLTAQADGLPPANTQVTVGK
jgi:beta-galactosidase